MTDRRALLTRPNPRLNRAASSGPGEGFGLSKPMSELLASLLLSPDLSFRDLVERSEGSAGGVAASRDALVERGIIERVRVSPGATTRPNRFGIRQTFAKLRTAYEEGGIHELAEVHHLALEESPPYARLFGMLQRACPFSELLGLAARLDVGIGASGLPGAANAALSELRDRWEIHLPRERSARRILRHAPLIVYGNHPSMLTPFLLAAALEREDLRFVAFGYVGKLVPAMASHIFPVFPTFRRSIRQSLSAGLSHILALSMLYRLDRVPSPDEARRRNREAIDRAIGHVGHGGATVIFPAAGRESGAWFPGLGAIVRGVAASDPAVPAYLVPIRVRNNANERVYAAIRSGRGCRTKPRICSRGPILVEIGLPSRIDRPNAAERTAVEISRRLQAQYEALT